MVVLYRIVETHPLARRIRGGRVRLRPGESVGDGIARRVAEDTRTEVLGWAEEPVTARASASFWLSLWGEVELPAERVEAMGTVRVQLALPLRATRKA